MLTAWSWTLTKTVHLVRHPTPAVQGCLPHHYNRRHCDSSVNWSYVSWRPTWQCINICIACPPSVRQKFLLPATDEDRAEVTDLGGCWDYGTLICQQSHRLLQQHPVRRQCCSHTALQNVLNAAARLILRKRKYDRITAAIRDSLHRLPVQQRIEYKMCVLVYKCQHQAAPIYLSELCILVATFTGRSHLRSAVKECLVTDYCRTRNYGQRSFSYSGPTLWNSLPLTLRDSLMSLM